MGRYFPRRSSASRQVRSPVWTGSIPRPVSGCCVKIGLSCPPFDADRIPPSDQGNLRIERACQAVRSSEGRGVTVEFVPARASESASGRPENGQLNRIGKTSGIDRRPGSERHRLFWPVRLPGSGVSLRGVDRGNPENSGHGSGLAVRSGRLRPFGAGSVGLSGVPPTGL